MFAFQIHHDDDHQLLIATNAHTKGDENVASFTASSKTGIVSSVTNCNVRDLVAADIFNQDADGTCRLRNLTDDSAEAQASCWGQIVKDNFCTCDEEPGVENQVRFERYGDDGTYDGHHGFACPKCRGIVQIG